MKYQIWYMLLLDAEEQAANITSVAEKGVTGLICAVGAAFAMWGLYEVGTGFSQHNAARQEAGIPKAVGGIGVILLAIKMVPEIFKFIDF